MIVLGSDFRTFCVVCLLAVSITVQYIFPEVCLGIAAYKYPSFCSALSMLELLEVSGLLYTVNTDLYILYNFSNINGTFVLFPTVLNRETAIPIHLQLHAALLLKATLTCLKSWPR